MKPTVKEKSIYLIMMEKLIEYKPTINPKLMTLIFTEIEIIKEYHNQKIKEIITDLKNGSYSGFSESSMIAMIIEDLKGVIYEK